MDPRTVSTITVASDSQSNWSPAAFAARSKRCAIARKVVATAVKPKVVKKCVRKNRGFTCAGESKSSDAINPEASRRQKMASMRSATPVNERHQLGARRKVVHETAAHGAGGANA